ncbi:hypothetical protein ASF88_09620 [Leifsonia sp. Leaf336]|uniref:hypothetical protein n=1 Tax=Leifsonia sp. Leaf336 TaxID=1736341 RepID=UPI0006F6C82C|nr:hypothetical protein [Leifsonia sp. Leaf336]KQR51859.1 hypothetical protein ASF88_09620 [Leifsonia sp. Leaf336]
MARSISSLARPTAPAGRQPHAELFHSATDETVIAVACVCLLGRTHWHEEWRPEFDTDTAGGRGAQRM